MINYIKRNISLFVVLICYSFPVFSEDIEVLRKPGKDVTSTYEESAAHIDTLFQNDNLLPTLQKYKILLVPGFLSDGIISLKGYGLIDGLLLRLGEYFDDQMKWFKNNNIEYERVKIESEAAPEVNAKLIAAVIESSPKEVIILAHSKGGIDTLTALLLYPSLRKKVKGFIPIQSPFWGSPIADWILENKTLDTLSCLILKAMGGTKKSLISLSTQTRDKFFQTHVKDIINILKEIPSLGFSSWKEKKKEVLFDSILAFPRDKMWEVLKVKSDGLVPVESALYPYIDYIQVGEADHAVTVMYTSKIKKFDRVLFTKTLLYLLLKRFE